MQTGHPGQQGIFTLVLFAQFFGAGVREHGT
jgi:hypothetical protein